MKQTDLDNDLGQDDDISSAASSRSKITRYVVWSMAGLLVLLLGAYTWVWFVVAQTTAEHLAEDLQTEYIPGVHVTVGRIKTAGFPMRFRFIMEDVKVVTGSNGESNRTLRIPEIRMDLPPLMQGAVLSAAPQMESDIMTTDGVEHYRVESPSRPEMKISFIKPLLFDVLRHHEVTLKESVAHIQYLDQGMTVKDRNSERAKLTIQPSRFLFNNQQGANESMASYQELALDFSSRITWLEAEHVPLKELAFVGNIAYLCLPAPEGSASSCLRRTTHINQLHITLDTVNVDASGTVTYGAETHWEKSTLQLTIKEPIALMDIAKALLTEEDYAHAKTTYDWVVQAPAEATEHKITFSLDGERITLNDKTYQQVLAALMTGEVPEASVTAPLTEGTTTPEVAGQAPTDKAAIPDNSEPVVPTEEVTPATVMPVTVKEEPVLKEGGAAPKAEATPVAEPAAPLTEQRDEEKPEVTTPDAGKPQSK
jgi:hypothetical protein